MRVLAALPLVLVACGSASPESADSVTESPSVVSVEKLPPLALAYPEGPYGKTVNAIFPEVTFEGYRDGDGEWSTLSMLDYFDPEGAKGIHAIYVVVAAQWCGVCQQEAARLPKSYPALKERGARFLMVLGQDNTRRPSTKLTIDAWQSRFHLTFDVGNDPKLQFLPPGATGFPTCYVIDPRTMKILKVLPGITSDGSIPGLEPLLQRNGG